MRGVKPIVESSSSSQVAVGAENVRAWRQLRLDFERTLIKVDNGQDSQLNVCKLDGRVGARDISKRHCKDTKLDGDFKLHHDNGIDAQHLKRPDCHTRGSLVHLIERLEPTA